MAGQLRPDPAAAAAYVSLALRHLRAGEVRLVMVGGLPGTGKSTVAGGVADELGAVLLRSDRLRKELALLSPEVPAAAPYRTGVYRPEATEDTYTAMLADAGAVLTRGESVVLDASWSDAGLRDRPVELAGEVGADLTRLQCVAPPEVARPRLLARTGDPSDADPAIATAMAADFAPWPSATAIVTTVLPSATVAAATREVRSPSRLGVRGQR